MVEPQIWGCERATARSHPQIWYLPTANPIEPLSNLIFIYLGFGIIREMLPLKLIEE
jgi:hypothetical protein